MFDLLSAKESKRNVGGSDLTLFKFRAEQGIVGYTAKIGKLMNIRDPEKYSKYSHSIDSHNTIPLKSIITVPIFRHDSATIGVISAEQKLDSNGNPTYFDEQDEYFMKSLGVIAGVMLCNVRFQEEMHMTQKQIEVLRFTTRSLSSTLNIDTLIRIIKDAAKNIMNADKCTLFLDVPEEKHLRAIIVIYNVILARSERHANN